MTGAFWQRHGALPAWSLRDPKHWGCRWPPALPQSSGTATGSPAAMQPSGTAPLTTMGTAGTRSACRKGFWYSRSSSRCTARSTGGSASSTLRGQRGGSGRLGAARGRPPVSPQPRTHSRAAPSTPRAAASAASPAPARMAPAPAPPQPGAERPPPGSPLPVLPPPKIVGKLPGLGTFRTIY